MQTNRDLSDSQWAVLDPLIPEPSRRKDGRGRPWKGRRAVLDGILWVLRTGAPWADLPGRYPSYQTCHRRFQQWVQSGILKGIFEASSGDTSNPANEGHPQNRPIEIGRTSPL